MRCRDGTSSTDLALPGQVSSELNVALGLAGVKGTSGCSMALLEGVFYVVTCRDFVVTYPV